MLDVTREEILPAIIEGYRNTIRNRYQYDHVKKNYSIPDSIDKVKVDELRTYFLTYVYPDYKKRQELNEAFKQLDDYIKQPKKLLRILLDTASLIFKYGRHLPKILKTGLKAMQTFKAASSFENKFMEEAIAQEIKPPYDEEKIETLLGLLPIHEVESFIETSLSLFETLHDRDQIKKIKEIIEYLIKTMKRKGNLYTESEIKALELGLELLKEGDKLFNTLAKTDQDNLIHLVVDIERGVLEKA